MFFSSEMLGAVVFGEVKYKDIVGVHVNLLKAYDQLFDPLLGVSLDELSRITQLQFGVPFNQIVVLRRIFFIDLKQIKTKSGFTLV